ncbi:putative quinol monooxygenase [Mesonia aestuariivivens]
MSYVLHQDVNNPLKIIILEEWKSQKAIDFHNQTEHFQLLKKN